MDMVWLVARTKISAERKAAHHIARQGFEYYMPVITTKVMRTKRSVELKTEFLFPGYIFVRSDGRWRCLMGTWGLIGVITFGGEPAIVPDDIIDQLREREDLEGRVQLPPRPVSRFRPGQLVQVRSGPFEGKIGIYEGSSTRERERILLDILGGRTTVLIAGSCLDAA